MSLKMSAYLFVQGDRFSPSKAEKELGIEFDGVVNLRTAFIP